MKSIKQLSFLGLLTTLILASCTLEKRVYLSGYHIDWLNGKPNPDKNKLKVEDISKNSEEDRTLTVDQSVITSSNTVDKPTDQSIEDINITASADNQPSFLPTYKSTLFHHTGRKLISNHFTEPKTVIKPATIKKKVNKSSTSDGGGKSQLVALLLCIFLGGIGIHRFYLGYIGIGVIQLLTAGGCGIWALIDLVMIITGDLKPKSGDYDKKF
jgi:hypothetical protein